MLSPTIHRTHQSISDLKQLIVQRRITYPASLERAMRLLLSNPDVVAFGTLRSVAHSCEVSGTTISRLARHSGYSSFKEMKEAFRKHVVLLAALHGTPVEQQGPLQ